MTKSRRQPPAGALVWALAATALVGCGDSSEDGAVVTTAAKPVIDQPRVVAEARVQSGRQLVSAGNYEGAVEEFTQALKDLGADTTQQVASPDAQILYERGVAFLEMGFPDTAAEDFTAVLRYRPNDGAALGKRGQAYTELGDFYRAIRDCTNAIRWDPKNADAYRYRGIAYLRRGQDVRARTDFDEAIVLDATLKGEIDAVLAEAAAAEAEAALASAAEDAEPSTDVTQTVAKPVLGGAVEHFEKGLEFQKQQQHDEALMEFTHAVSMEPDYADAYVRRGETLLALGFPDSASRDFGQAVRIDPRLGAAHRLQAEAFVRLGNHYRAVMSATEALYIDPSDARAYAIRGGAYVELGDAERAIADLEAAQTRDPALQPQVERALAKAQLLRQEAEKERREQAAEDASRGI